MIKKYHTIEGVLEYINSTEALKKKHTYSEDFLIGVNIARNMFLTRVPGLEENENNITLPDCPEGGYCWKFETRDDIRPRLIQFLEDCEIPRSYHNTYLRLCENWSGRPKNQRSIIDFLKRGSSSTSPPPTNVAAAVENRPFEGN
jgi:hypothetical protein